MNQKQERQYQKDKFEKILPAEYAEELRKRFVANPQLWQNVITPAKKADELRIKTNNDYSQIWETYCDNCFMTIDKSTKQVCYVSEDQITFLCSACYSKIFDDS